jgi:hypothetical protein
MSLTLVNLFTVPPGEEDAFAARFKTVVENLAGMPGFEGTELHRYAWREALPKIMAQGGLMTGGVVPKAALYESVLRVSTGA